MSVDFVSTLTKKVDDTPQFDFIPVTDDDNENGDPWEHYIKLCYNANPPITALSIMKPILSGHKFNANLSHYRVGRDLPVILKVLVLQKNISSLDLSDNSLDEECIPQLIHFMTNTDSVSVLNISNNPKIRTKGIMALLDGIHENRSLETLNISNTGAQNIGSSLAKIVSSCQLLVRIDAEGCGLKQSAIDLANAIPSAEKLKRLNLAKNMLHAGGKKFATLLGSSCAKCSALRKLFLSENAIDDDMCVALLKGLGDSPALTVLDLSKNMIGEGSGKAISNFITKVQTLKSLDISQNPILNVTINILNGQKKLDEGGDKDQNKKDKKPKSYTPGVFQIFNALPKNQTLMILKMIGVVCVEDELSAKITALQATNSSLSIVYRAPESNYATPKTSVPLPRVDSSDEELSSDEDA